MASLREIRRKTKNIKNTQQITRAMKMVATATTYSIADNRRVPKNQKEAESLEFLCGFL